MSEVVYHLRDINVPLVAAWSKAFAGIPQVGGSRYHQDAAGRVGLPGRGIELGQDRTKAAAYPRPQSCGLSPRRPCRACYDV